MTKPSPQLIQAFGELIKNVLASGERSITFTAKDIQLNYVDVGDWEFTVTCLRRPT